MSLDDITLAVDYFDLKKIAESGQCFRWKELGPGKYLIPSSQTCAIMEQKEPDDDLHLLIEEGTLPLWQDYLNYGERYGSIVREAREATLADGSPDLFLREAVLEAAGVQILTQDLWETLVSFVISQNNNIPRIKKLVAALCKQFGERRQLAGHEFYTFPTWERLAGQDLSSLGLGYRDKYVEQLAQNVTDGRIDRHGDRAGPHLPEKHPRRRQQGGRLRAPVRAAPRRSLPGRHMDPAGHRRALRRQVPGRALRRPRRHHPAVYFLLYAAAQRR